MLKVIGIIGAVATCRCVHSMGAELDDWMSVQCVGLARCWVRKLVNAASLPYQGSLCCRLYINGTVRPNGPSWQRGVSKNQRVLGLLL